MRETRRAGRWLAVAGVIALFYPSQAPGQEAAEAERIAVPEADEVLRGMATFLAAQREFSFDAEINFDAVDPTGRKLQFAGALGVGVKRPNLLYMDYIDDLSAKRLWYDGERITLLDRDHDVYTSEPAGPDIDAALALLDKSFNVSLPLADFLLSDPYAELKQGELGERWIGRHDVGGIDCDHLAFVDENIDWQIWIEPGERPLPRKLVVTYKTIAGSPQYVAVLSNWNLEAKSAANLFAAQIPESAKAADFLVVEEKQ